MPRPFSDPLDPFHERPRRASRSQRRLEESARREQATRHIGRLSTTHDAPLRWRLGVYGLITVGTTLVVWRLTHWIVWAYDPSRRREHSRRGPPEARVLCRS